MNPELQKELASWLASLRETTQHGASFAIEQAPLVVQEKLIYGRITETIGLLLALVILAAGLWCLSRARRWLNDDDNPTGFIVGFIGASCGTVFTLLQVDALAKVLFAPRLYIVEWLAGLLSGVA